METSRRKIVFVEDEIDLNILHFARKFRILKQSYFENLLIICCNYSLLNKAKDLFKNVRYLFDLIDIDDIQYNSFKEARGAAFLFLKKIKRQKHLHSILLRSLQELFYSVLISKAIFKNTIKTLDPDAIILLPYRRHSLIPFRKRFDFGLKNGIFNPVINSLAENQKNIKVKKIPLIIALLVAPKNIFQFFPFDGFIRLFLSVWKNLFSIEESDKKIFKGENKGSEKIFINWGSDLIKHTNLSDLSNELKDLDVVHLFFKKEELKHRLPNHYFYNKKPIRVYFLKNIFAFISKSIRAFNDYNFILKTNPAFEKFNIKELFSAYFYFYLHRTIIVESYRKWLFSVFKLHLPKLFITSDLYHYIGRTFVFTAREVGAKVYTFSHGCPLFIPCIDPIESLGDKILVSGQGVASNIKKTGVSDYRFNVVGEKNRVISNFFNQSKKQKTIVLFTSMKLISWIDEQKNLSLFFKTMEALVDKLLSSGFKVIIKSHKLGDYWEFYDKLVEKYKCFPINHIKRRWKSDELKICDVAIFPGGISTTILSCQAAGLPVIYIDILSKIEREILKYDYYNCGVIVKTAQQAFECVKRLFVDEGYLKNTLKLGRQFYESHIDITKDFTKDLAKNLKSKTF